jgi:hypothetical protein
MPAWAALSPGEATLATLVTLAPLLSTVCVWALLWFLDAGRPGCVVFVCVGEGRRAGARYRLGVASFLFFFRPSAPPFFPHTGRRRRRRLPRPRPRLPWFLHAAPARA